MRILFVGIDAKPNPGGIAELTHNLMHEMSKIGDDVYLLTRKNENADIFDKEQNYITLRSNIDPIANPLCRKIVIYFNIIRSYISVKPDVIICNTYDRLTVYVFNIARILKIPFCIYVHGLDVSLKRKKRHEKVKKNVLKKSFAVFANSMKTAEIINAIGVDSKNIYRITPGVTNSTVFSDRKQQIGYSSLPPILQKSKHLILSVGRLIPRKGFDTMILAMKVVLQENPGTVYVILSDGPDRDRLERIVAEQGVGKSVYFAGYVSNDDKQIYYQNADIFVMPNRDLPNGDMEGFGIVFLEANLHEIPVLGGKAGGVPDAIEHGKTGFLVNPSNPVEVANAINTLISSPEIAKEMGQYGRKRALQQFSWPARAEEMHMILKSMNIEIQKKGRNNGELV